MGGSALGRQARRLTTPQLEILTRHCISRLTPTYFSTVKSLKFTRDKDSHGDIDLICGWDEKLDPKLIKGEDWGVIFDGKDQGVGDHHPVRGPNRTNDTAEKRGERDLKDGEENGKFRKWVVDVVKAIEGDQWKRSGTNGVVISVGIPCRGIEGIDIGPKDDEEEFEPFYQVDLQLCATRYIDCTILTRSYSNTILTHAVSYISPQLRLHGSHLGLHYSPFHNIEPIKMEITSCPEELCDWLGLDYTRALEGFDSEKDLWNWTVTFREGGAIEGAWKAATDPKRKFKKGKGGKSKDRSWLNFISWLREGEDSPYSKARLIPTPSVEGEQVCTDLAKDGQTTSTRDQEEQNDSEPAILNAASLASLAALVTETDKNLIDPENPTPLHHRVQAVLDRFGKTAEVKEVLKQRKEAAISLAERQKRRLGLASSTSTDSTVAVSTASMQTVMGSMGKLIEQVEKVVLEGEVV